ncbi:DNA-directed RNA polymerase 2 [Plasmodium gonderi]|uniref:DNA-directed RNA polymerase 2 n=1 Tax=Plasmodium gonderi TaxID=77519 RepID=A0A1Y1J998_PLAGO|nr:DNA-directed RNA polymerase 2 [Plasmodium gonderi]GAW79076.1 DNA-directed RNA polymerase 2 [Plasmodium gonderi]
MAEVTFCEECNNILYARSDRKSKKLLYVCRSCEYISHKLNDQHNIVTRINYNYNRKEDIYIHPETKNDPALGRVRDWMCKNCGNNEAVFLQLPERISYNPMALIYVCTGKNCRYWEKEIQGKNEDADVDALNKSGTSSEASYKDDHMNTSVKEQTNTSSHEEGKHNYIDERVKRNRKEIKRVNNHDVDEEQEGDKLKQELHELINPKEEQHHSAPSDFGDENESDVEDYFCE